MKKLLVLCSSLILAGASYSMDFSPKMPEKYSVKYFHNFGSIDGFVQIPRGGQFNTTSERRPEFKELGIKRINYPELNLSTKWENFGMYLNLKYNYFKGNSTLKEDLKTHDIQLKAGDKISSKHKYGFYALGFSYDFNNVVNNLVLTPKIEFSLFDFSYKFSASGSKAVNNDERKFHAGAVRIGGSAKYSFNKDFSLTFDAMTHIPYDSIRKSFETSLVASYNLYRNDKQELNLLAGVGYDMFKYRDTQKDMQNFMNYKTKPIYKIGLEYSF